MNLTRRGALALGAGFAATVLLPATALHAAVDEALAKFTGGAAVGEGGITLSTPEIAENGNTVPVSVSAPGAVAIMLLAEGNPSPGVCTFNFGPLAASQSATTRIRLAGTQRVIAVAKMADGSFVQAANEVKVTIGGCGG
ncbi:thiosulfate oxidation carrier protein SoxY [Limibaculum sp. M0105]|uniref:Thiosulfate oxidation carrier protein SoxY n=1 Tax=Thermohalobaculum xanthum TaxID=2753746 RepID=A0A8J7SDB8_9RHOB|nr:thiosulfate oxidation carrier protein SoxY [Thermohalobaculum xanthum]MBK0398337.1 thiosulfate oxidation carrier protein SoxY [Thermohalobaculum xanthum]